MIKIPNYNVVVPTTPDLTLSMKPRTTSNASRNNLEYKINVTDATHITLPWIPIAQDWVEIYLDGIRIVNPRITSVTGGSLFEVFNVSNNVITFNEPINGEVTVICDTEPTHFWGSLIINAKNVQGFYVYTTVHDFEILKWTITAGTVNGLTYNVFYEPGPQFQANSYVVIENCMPSVFNGNFKVLHSTPESVTFRGETTLEIRDDDPSPIVTDRVWYNTTSKKYNHAVVDKVTSAVTIKTYQTKSDLAKEVTLVESPPGKSYMTKFGTVSGFGNATVKQLQGISLYSEPIIITQPRHGYARLTTDRRSIAYIPNINYKGFDTFSWSMINQHGQIGTPKCVQINIRDF